MRREVTLPADGTPLGDVLAGLARSESDAVALVVDGHPVARGELSKLSDDIAGRLAEFGVARDQMVALQYADPIQFVAGVVATWKVGATPIPLSASMPDPELQAVLDIGSAVALVGSEAAASPGVPTVPRGWSGPDVRTPGLEITARSPAHSWKAPTSGGSTGRPKLIVSTAEARFDSFHVARWRIPPGGTLVVPAPLYHNAPFQIAMYGILSGGTVVVSRRFDAEKTLAAVEKHRAEWMYLVPTMMSRIWRLPQDVRLAYDVSSLETVWHLAAPCPPWLKRCWIDWLGPERILELYSATEGIAYTVIDGREWLDHPGSVGRVVVGEMRILDDQGVDVSDGEVGEVFMHPGPHRAKPYRYIGAEPHSIQGWESVGDMGRFGPGGYLYLEDRKADMILVGGVNVFPAEVEAAIERHPDVVGAVVVGLPDDDLGQSVHAVVELVPGAQGDTDAIRRSVADYLAPHKVPRTVHVVDRALRDDTGKVRRAEVRTDVRSWMPSGRSGSQD